jgi:hypothetical protein
MIMRLAGFFVAAAFALSSLAQETTYKNDFEKAEVGSLPDEFLLIEGGFAVKEANGNKHLELPGSPLDTYGFLFGPTFRENATATARFFGEARGRRFPTFDLGLNGVGGYRLRVSPGKKQLEILRSDALKQSVPLEWTPGKWTHLKLTVTRQNDKFVVSGKFWQEGGKEPAKPTITFTDSEAPPAGRASIFASPYSGLPIRFDDLSVSPAK